MARSWQLGPVLRGIRGHRAAAVLVVVQLAIGLAITVLAVLIGEYFLSDGRVARGHVSPDLTIVEVHWAGRGPHAQHRAIARDKISHAAGVVAVADAQLPFGVLERSRDDVRTATAAAPVYEVPVGPGIAQAVGLRVIAGRDLSDGDVATTGALVSASLAATLWPGRAAVGETFTSRGHGAAVVVGVVDDMRTVLFGREGADILYAVDAPYPSRAMFVVRSDAGRAAETRRELPVRLVADHGASVVSSAAELARQFERPFASVLGILAAMVSAIVAVILIGAMGLTYFLVSARTHEIGLRRAMGATRRDVVRHFLLENLILTAAGVLIGLAIMAVVLPALFAEQQGFTVRWLLVAAAVATLVGLNILATLIPARRAAAVPPVVAGRTV